MTAPKPPAIIRRSASARRAWRELWELFADNDMAEEIYRPMVTALAMELGLAEDAADAVFRPIDPDTGTRSTRTLEEYLQGDGTPRNSQTAQELTLLRDSLRQVAKLAAEFGASPAARKRIGSVEKAEKESPMMQYIRAANDKRAKRATG